MKHFLVGIIICIALTITCSAQPAGTPPPYGVSNCTYITTIPCELEVIGQDAKKVKIVFTGTIWTTTSGSFEYTTDVNTLEFSEDIEIADTMTATEIFDLVCAEVIATSVQAGYSNCPATSSETTGVTLHSCVIRTATSYDNASGSLNRRYYTYTCASNGSVSALLAVDGDTDCGENGEPTWSSEGELLQ